jgi:hypothetical protein
VNDQSTCVIYALEPNGENGAGRRAAPSRRADRPTGGFFEFRCNVCGEPGRVRLADLSREVASCAACASTVRWRAMVHVLSLELFGRSIPLPEFPVRKDISGIGLTDWRGYAVRLAEKLDYRNTFLHQEPRLDIVELDPAWEKTQDFVIASDVFEHVDPPVSRAFENLRKLLKPNGFVVFSAPHGQDAEAKEHFPNLFRYELVETRGRTRLVNTTIEGEREVYDDLVFHGGPGATLEMRVFSEAGLLRAFSEAGFASASVYRDQYLAYGIYFDQPWGLPIVARAGAKENGARG